jgi:hypothetical protein
MAKLGIYIEAVSIDIISCLVGKGNWCWCWLKAPVDGKPTRGIRAAIWAIFGWKESTTRPFIYSLQVNGHCEEGNVLHEPFAVS